MKVFAAFSALKILIFNVLRHNNCNYEQENDNLALLRIIKQHLGSP